MCVSISSIAERDQSDRRIRDEVVVARVQFGGSITPWPELEPAIVALCSWNDVFAVVVFGGGVVHVGVCESWVPSDSETASIVRNVYTDVFE
jgi:hypothetical protein